MVLGMAIIQVNTDFHVLSPVPHFDFVSGLYLSNYLTIELYFVELYNRWTRNVTHRHDDSVLHDI